jgi:hypothetical protein
MKTKQNSILILIVSLLLGTPMFAQEQVFEPSPEVGINKFMVLLFVGGIALGYYKLVLSNKLLKNQ